MAGLPSRPFTSFLPRRRRLPAISGQEFYAVRIAFTPNDFTRLMLPMRRYQLQSEHVADIDRRICHDLGTARRDVQYDAFAPRRSVVDRDPARLLVHVPPRFARDLCPRLVNSHHEYPSLDLSAIGHPILPRFRKCHVRALPRNLSVYIPEIAVTARLAYLQCPCDDCILDQTEWPDGIGEISDGGRRSRCRDSTACEAAEQGHPGCSKTSARSICQSCRQGERQRDQGTI